MSCGILYTKHYELLRHHLNEQLWKPIVIKTNIVMNNISCKRFNTASHCPEYPCQPRCTSTFQGTSRVHSWRRNGGLCIRAEEFYVPEWVNEFEMNVLKWLTSSKLFTCALENFNKTSVDSSSPFKQEMCKAVIPRWGNKFYLNKWISNHIKFLNIYEIDE